MKKILISLLFLIQTGISFSQPEIPVLKYYATDLTSTLSSEQTNFLSNDLRIFDDSTSNQVVFLMISSLEGYPIEMFTYDVADKNKIGTKENSNGVLFFVSKNDRKMRIEVGYGLEGALPDALCSSIIRNEVTPFFKKDEYYSGVLAGLDAIKKATVGEYKRKPEEKDGNGFGIWIIIAIFILISLFGKGRGRGSAIPIILGGMLGGGGRSGGFGGFGGGSSGGGFGGFSGGGGGFGGGGASGGW
ncbi:MAG: TPM domain-containing protein [bacterium]